MGRTNQGIQLLGCDHRRFKGSDELNTLPATATNILVAGTPDAVATVKYALGSSFHYLPAYSVKHAVSLLSQDPDVILCSVAFDGSRMFDFVRAVRESSKTRSIPVICFRHQSRPLSRTSHDAIEMALTTVGLTSFIDLYAITEEATLSHALLALRTAVLSAVGVESPAEDWCR